MPKSKITLNITLAFVSLFFLSFSSESQEVWKDNWNAQIVILDSTFYPIQRQLRLSRSYQNDANEAKILADIDSLNHFKAEINSVIDQCNMLELPDTVDGRNAAEAVRLKIEALKEYLEQCQIQIRINNEILQKKLKNETLNFKVLETEEVTKGFKTYMPNFK